LIQQKIFSRQDGFLDQYSGVFRPQEANSDRRRRPNAQTRQLQPEISAARDKKEIERLPMPFTGDSSESPPFGWTLLWNETYSNVFGDEICPDLHHWGYIFWDVKTYKSTGADRLLIKQNEEYHYWDREDEDIRDNMW
jgi:hypothetical protein